MTIKIDAHTEATLIVRIAEKLQTVPCKSTHLTHEVFAWADDLIDDLSADARAKIDRFVGERGLSNLIRAEFEQDRSKWHTYIKIGAGRPLTQFPFVEDTIGYAKKLIAVIKSLPIRYRLTVALPPHFSAPLLSEVPDVTSLPSNIIICRGSHLPAPLPVYSKHEMVDMGLFHDWNKGETVSREFKGDRFYFTMPMSGYAFSPIASIIGRSLEDHIKAFYGASLATGFTSISFDNNQDKLSYIAIHTEDPREIIATEQIEEELLGVSAFSSTSSFARRNNSDIWAAYQTAITKVGTIFNDNVDCRRLFSACVWYYRSRINSRPLDALLQATIAIEVMLGDRKASEGIGLTNLLASRCSYLLGRSSQHREEIMANFKRVYDLRSQIVHEGRHILQTGDRETVRIANSLCASIIHRELDIRSRVES
ncbi:hypothetical protein EWE75_23505 [Sphingomonas populi]|uniref:Uncharacterized protein n=1 Tax=Sphingomonas populi TaxID=2484750 RepID=A0A4V2DBT6_9SPHN|nr:HEPN domain-containing protein [Sphingomonas populi]RZF59118.1 hypothetical protein EWE75_23505 [Sphingomonas populi]